MGLVWRDGKLYVTDPPDLVTLEDTDGDGKANRRTIILTGFGHTDDGSLHGLIFGPDGLLYMTMGSPDGYELRRKDGAFLEGQSGALIRCRPNGSEPEVVCRGFVNLIEVAVVSHLGGAPFGVPQGVLGSARPWEYLRACHPNQTERVPSGQVSGSAVHVPIS